MHLVKESEDRLSVEAVCKTSTEVVGSIKIEKGSGVAGVVWETAEALIVNGYANWSNKFIDNRIGTMKAAIGVPMLVVNKVVGVIGLGAMTKNRFTAQHVEIL